jgi:hypothetical protein
MNDQIVFQVEQTQQGLDGMEAGVFLRQDTKEQVDLGVRGDPEGVISHRPVVRCGIVPASFRLS